MGWVAFVAAVVALTGGYCNFLSRVAREQPGGPIEADPYGWAGSKAWRLGLLVFVVAIVAGVTTGRW